MTKVFYRLTKPHTFSNSNFETLEEAQKALIEFGSTPQNEYYDYWQGMMKQCKILKVTETTEEI
jgi:hypothetical protein